ncbi:G2/M phase-specific E3 ubiquitin-protein ligase-like isoform X3 [Triplophysa dalaica]|uniref:G2/M phase-specific E3 ubiquitin-protein ligase-like isoform X3 n=1 Tax=Triplophysa dalaica TaxID=1582913 RepID=UPI0024DF4FB1|nr:G2/M phase-specific E3 ubiquitin-protein ligase-like isoform X3 [Triplophysa dalaica]XP_056624926.1 G2/M phase-specific E3 ubiquitin-protein ligase-like isoform X3 [Triplophysa dalaica]XP_056625816.1 G2/M phase-specific E3 ubiquitin-protein ligase-like isoform X3 [Triplophysa dalaica]
MYCPFCGAAVESCPAFCSACGHSVKFLKNVSNKVPDENQPSTSEAGNTGRSSLDSFMKFRALKEKERKTFFTKKCQASKKDKKTVKIYVGVMWRHNGVLKPVRGKTLPLEVQPNWSSEQLLTAAVKKVKDFNQDIQDGPYVLLYPDGAEVKHIPGTNTPFRIELYKEALGKAYQRITLFTCTVQDFSVNDDSGDSSSEESEVIIKSTSNSPYSESDTLVWDGPNEASTPKAESTSDRPPQPILDQEGGENRTNIQNHTQGPQNCYTNYTRLYAPIVIKSDSEESDGSRPYVQEERDALTAADIVSDLSSKIIKTSCSRFNINRANVWDGAARGFKRASYDPSHDMLVKFTDDEGTTEDAVDTGGPKREFLTLLMDCLRTRRIFEGPEHQRFLTFNSAAAREDEYFLAGRMIAGSIVHGGPGPRFLSEMLYNNLTGRIDFDGTIEDVTDEIMKTALLEISGAASLDELHMLIDKYSSLLQTAGCFEYPQSVEGKQNIVKDFIQWYIIYRNQYSIQRFRDGLSTLDVINALEQHPIVFTPYMCCGVEKLTPESLEAIFKAQLSEVGSTRRQEETRIIGYWRDYLLDTGEQEAGLSLQDILMFATGLDSLPPSTIVPQPKLCFERTSSYPIASTCTNTIKLPMSKSYEELKNAMDFGIQNSPGFGLQ